MSALTNYHRVYLHTCRTGTLINLTADGRSLDAVTPAVDDFLSSLPEKPVAGAPWGTSANGLVFPKRNEALTVPTQVSVIVKIRQR